MEELKKLFTFSINSNIEDRKYEIAKKLINNYYIDNGACLYEIVELEFYLHHPKDKDIDLSVYPRLNKKAGDIFYHYSGIDICFANSENNTIYGGILVRAVHKVNDDIDMVYGGPFVCMLEMLNTSISPLKIVRKEHPTDYDCCDNPTKRVGINDNKQLRFYRKPTNEKARIHRYACKRVGEKIIETQAAWYNWYNNMIK